MDTQPFLTRSEFEAMVAPRALTAGERALVELLVAAAAEWIRHPDRRPGLAITDPMATQAKLVTYDVVSNALGAAGVDPRVRQITTSTDNRQTSITYADAARLLDFDDRHLVMLDLATTAAPQARFDAFDVAFDDCGPRQW